MNGKVKEDFLSQGRIASIKSMYPEEFFIKRYSNMLNQPFPVNPNKLCSINQYNIITEEHNPLRIVSPINSYIKVTPQPLAARDIFLSEASSRYRHLEGVLPRVHEVNSQLINQPQIHNLPSDRCNVPSEKCNISSEITPELLLRQKHEILKQRELENILLREQLNIQALKIPNLSKYALSLLYNTNKRHIPPPNDCATAQSLDNNKHNSTVASQEVIPAVFPNTHNALIHEELIRRQHLLGPCISSSPSISHLQENINEELSRRQHLLEIERDIHILQSIRTEEIIKTTSFRNHTSQPYLSETNKHQLNKTSRLTEYEFDALKNAELIRNQKNHGSKTKFKENHLFPGLNSNNESLLSYQSNTSKELKQNLIIEEVNEKKALCKQSEVDYQPVVKKAKKLCSVCGEPSQFICSGCLKSWYCTQTCQAKDWKVHNTCCGKSKKDFLSSP